MSRTLCNARILRTLPYSKLSLSKILSYLGPEACSRSCFYKHIQAYSGIFNNDSYKNLNFIFFTLILHTSQQNFKIQKLFGYNDVNFNARPSLPRQYATFE